MPNWKTKALAAIRAYLQRGTVQFTEKAMKELAALSMYEHDALEVMMELTALDLVDRIRSTSSGEWLYVFKPSLEGTRLYVKLAFRKYCDVISFHPDSGEDANEQD